MSETVMSHTAAEERSGAKPDDRDRANDEVRSLDGRGPDPVQFPVSHAQQSMWTAAQLDRTPGSLVIVRALRLRGALQRQALRSALAAVQERHESLRTRFVEDGGGLRQLIDPPSDPPMTETDLSGVPHPEEKCQSFLGDRSLQPIDLRTGPPWRVHLVRLEERDHVLAVLVHHIVADGWSLEVLQRDLAILYHCRCEDAADPLPPLRDQYRDYAARQRSSSAAEKLEEARVYWRKKLSRPLPQLQLAPGSASRSQSIGGAASLQVEWDELTLAELRSLAVHRDASLFMALQAIVKILLFRYSGQRDLVVGTPVAGRESADLEDQVGLFMNLVVLRDDVDPQFGFSQFLASSARNCYEAYLHQGYPFDRLVEELAASRDHSRNPFFDVMVALQNFRPASAQAAGLQVSDFRLESADPDYDLTFEFVERPGGLLLKLSYRCDLFAGSTIERLAGHLTRLLESALAQPERPIGDLPLLTRSEREQLVQWSVNESPYPSEQSVAELFSQQASATPDAVALMQGDEEWSYGLLEERSNRLAHYLRKRLGPLQERLVGVLLERSPELIASLLGILKAGGAYLPLDPEYPSQRLELMIEDSAAVALLTQSALRQRLPRTRAEVLCLEAEAEAIESSPAEALQAAGGGDRLAYVTYTSGSTGRPKGAAVPQRGVVRLVKRADYIGIGAGDRIAQASNVSFDAATFEIWGALLNGAAASLLSREDLLDPARLSAFLSEGMANVLFLTTALFNRLAQGEAGIFAGLDHLLFGGEAVDPRWVREVAEGDGPKRLLHVYGPTESTTFATWQEVERVSEDAATVPIGIPVSNTQAWVLDGRLQLSPVGVAGELYLGGDGLARGYVGDPAQTAQRFLPHPFGEGERLYRTGDLARWRNDGSMEFLGRLDGQVKLRGFRIELGEVEAALRSQEQVKEAAAAVIGEGGRRRLVAWVQASQGALDGEAVLRGLKKRLPSYMLPGRLVEIERLPLTANGKVDRAALPEPEEGSGPTLSQPAKTPEEKILAGIWSEVLERESIGRNENFFQLGGDSILSIRIVARARDEGFHFTVRDLFQNQTVAELAIAASRAEKHADEAPQPDEPAPLTPIQQWFVERDEEEPWHFNQAVLLKLRREIDVERLRRALQAVVDAHAALNLRFRQTASGWVQSSEPARGELPFQVEDLSGHSGGDQKQILEKRATAWQRRLRLDEGPLFRLVLFRLSEGDRLFWCIHHLAVDGVSWRVLLEDLQSAAAQAIRGQAIQLPRPTAAYTAWARQLDEYSRSPQIDDDARYWRSLPEAPSIPKDLPGADALQTSAASCRVALDTDATRALLQEAPGTYNARINDLLLTALAQALTHWLRKPDCLVNVEAHGRVERPGWPNVSNTVGWFTSVYPVRFVLPADGHPGACLKAVKEQLRTVPAEGLAYGVLRYLSNRKGPPLPSAEIAFNYLGQLDQVTGKGLFELSDEGVGETHSRRGRLAHPIDVSGWVRNGRLQFVWTYSESQYRAETIQRLADDFLASLSSLVEHCLQPAAAGYTPSDFPLAKLTQQQLDRLAIRSGRNVAAVYPLTPLQQGMVFHSLKAKHDSHAEQESSAYFEQLHCRIDGELEIDRFRAAWEALLRRHPILRTGIWTPGDEPLQVVYRSLDLPFSQDDWRSKDSAAQERELEALLAQERLRSFELTAPPLLRCRLLALGQRSWRFVLCFHHLLLDGWSLSIVFRDFFHLYADPAAALPPAPSYQGFLTWLERQGQEAAAEYWKEYLSGFGDPTPLPVERTAFPTDAPEDYAELQGELDAEQSGKLIEFARAQRLTMSTLLQGAWALLLSRYSGEDDIVFGVTVSGRDIDLPNVENMVGLLINTTPLRVRIEDKAAADWLRAMQENHQGNCRFAYAPLAELQRYRSPATASSLFNSLIVFENYPIAKGLSESQRTDFRVSDVRAIDHTSYPLTVVASGDEVVSFRIGFDRRRFRSDDVARVFDRLKTLLMGLTSATRQTRLSAVSMLTDQERRTLLEWSRARESFASQRTLVRAFADQAGRSPGRIALVFGPERLTYGELDARSNRLAGLLVEQGVKRDDLVGLCASPSLPLVVAILAILKAGGAYVPLDPNSPSARLALILEDARVVALVTERRFDRLLPQSNARRFYLDDLQASSAQSAPNVSVKPEGLAYVIYTSGSTGKPKGAMITHANVARLFQATEDDFQFSDDDVWTLFHSSAFDFSVWEIWGALLYGGKLVIVSSATARDPEAFHELLERERVTVLNQTPSAFRQLTPVARRRGKRLALRWVIFGGEALDPPSLRPWFELYGDRSPQLVNMYGITETTVHVTWRPLRMADCESRASLIGRPLRDLDLYLLDRNDQPVPTGVAGEIHVGGPGLARGYLNRPQLSAEKFVETRVFDRRQRLYCSGDLARWLPDGDLEFLGRLDHQVKLRGYRVELGEIESVLADHDQIREAVVTVHGSAPQQSLAAYLVTESSFTGAAELRQWLKRRLPEYMAPANFVTMERLPLTQNGKVDRKALPSPTESSLAESAALVPLQGPFEERIAAIWRRVLNVEEIGREHNFFELGGHSLTAMQAASRIHRDLGAQIPPRYLFECPTIAALAPRIQELVPTSYDPIQPAPQQELYPLSHAQSRIWLEAEVAGTAAYNIPAAFQLREGVDRAVLERAFAALIRRHEILRTAFVEEEGEPRQLIQSESSFTIHEIDLRSQQDPEGRTREIADEEAARPFDLTDPPLLRATLVQQADSRCAFILVIHHIISDGWSLNLLYQELTALYHAFLQGRSDPLAPLRIQYKDYAVWQQIQGLDRNQDFWIEKLQGASALIRLPFDLQPSPDSAFQGDRLSVELDSAATRSLKGMALRHRSTLSNVALALFGLLLSKASRQDDLCVGMAVANRSHPDLEKLVGFFVNILPLRMRLSGDMEFDQFLQQVTSACHEALEHQDYPFDLLVQQLGLRRGDSPKAFLNAVFVFQNDHEVRLEVPESDSGESGREVQSLDFSFPFAKFDLMLIAAESSGRLKLTLEYNSGLWREGTIRRYLDALTRFAGKVAADAAQ